MPAKKKNIQISIPMDLYEEIEASREQSLLTKTAWFTLASREKLEKERGGRQIKKTIDL